MEECKLINIYQEALKKDSLLTQGLKPWVKGEAFEHHFNKLTLNP